MKSRIFLLALTFQVQGINHEVLFKKSLGNVNGTVESGLMADQYKLTGNEKSLLWFYAYAEYRNGKWTSMCTPADHNAPSSSPKL